MAVKDFKEIEWPERVALVYAKEMEKNRKFVEMLCKLGSVTEWLNGVKGRDGYTHMPSKYKVEGVAVEFLPHWGFYKLEGKISLEIPTSEADLLKAVYAVEGLKMLGLR